jgi:hypothetical protein
MEPFITSYKEGIDLNVAKHFIASSMNKEEAEQEFL